MTQIKDTLVPASASLLTFILTLLLALILYSAVWWCCHNYVGVEFDCLDGTSLSHILVFFHMWETWKLLSGWQFGRWGDFSDDSLGDVGGGLLGNSAVLSVVSGIFWSSCCTFDLFTSLCLYGSGHRDIEVCSLLSFVLFCLAHEYCVLLLQKANVFNAA